MFEDKDGEEMNAVTKSSGSGCFRMREKGQRPAGVAR